MNILQVHNFYQQPGGEDQVFAAECDLLARHGHSVTQYSVHNDAVESMPRLEIAFRTIWCSDSYQTLRSLLSRDRIDLVHVHNTLPLLSPSVYYAARAERVPVVQTLHNFRLVCPAATLFRTGRVCEDCVSKRVPYPGVLHSCYRESLSASASVVSMLTAHRLAGTWSTKINTFLALTNFARSKFIEGGLPAEKITVKSNFVPDDPGVGSGAGGYALYLGRLSEEKGIRTLLEAWKELGNTPLRIAGDGPLRDLVASFAQAHPQVLWLGHCGRSQVVELLQNASALVVPSEWYEPAVPLNILDATACGTPVILSNLGSLGEWATQFGTGFLFSPGSAQDLARTVRSVLSQPVELLAARKSMRAVFEAAYTPERNYAQLKDIYQKVLLNLTS